MHPAKASQTCIHWSWDWRCFQTFSFSFSKKAKDLLQQNTVFTAKLIDLSSHNGYQWKSRPLDIQGYLMSRSMGDEVDEVESQAGLSILNQTGNMQTHDWQQVLIEASIQVPNNSCNYGNPQEPNCFTLTIFGCDVCPLQPLRAKSLVTLIKGSGQFASLGFHLQPSMAVALRWHSLFLPSRLPQQLTTTWLVRSLQNVACMKPMWGGSIGIWIELSVSLCCWKTRWTTSVMRWEADFWLILTNFAVKQHPKH